MAIKKKKNYREILYELQKEAVTNNTGVSNDDLVKTAKQQSGNEFKTAYKPGVNTTTNKANFSRTGNLPVSTAKAKNTNFLDNAWYVGKKTGSGIAGGIAGLYESVTNEAVRSIQKSEEEDKGFWGQAKDVVSATKYILNPFELFQEEFGKTLSANKKILNDKDMSLFDKGVGLFSNAVNLAVESNPYKRLTDETVQMMSEVASDISPEYSSEYAEEFYQKPVKPLYEWQQELNEEGQEYGKVTQTIGDTGEVVGRMFPSIATTMITKDPTYGMAMMGLSTKGTSTREALNRGADLEEAIKVGNTKAVVEVGTEMITGGLNIFGKGALDDIVEKGIDKKVKNEVLNFLAKKGFGIAGEIGEETITDILNASLDRGTVDPNATYSIDDFGETALITILSTVVLNGLTGGYSPSAYNANRAEMYGVDKLAEKTDVTIPQELQVEETTEEDIAPTQEGIDEETQSKRRYYQYTPAETDSEIARTIKESASKSMNDSKRSHEFVDMVVKLAEKTGTNYKFTNDAELKQLGKLVEKAELTEEQQKQLTDLQQQLNEAKTQQEYDEIQKKIDNIVYYKTNGLVNENGEVLINIDSQNALNRIVGHETFHLVENEAEADKLRKFAKKYAETKGDYQERLDRANRIYANTKANIENEVTADIIGDYLFTDQQFINNLSTEQPSLFQKIYNEIKHWIKMVTAGSKEARQLEQLQHSFEKALNSKQTSETTLDGDTKFSLISDEADKTFSQKVNNTRAKVMKKLGKTDQAIWKKTGYQYNEAIKKWQTEVSDPKFKPKTKVEAGREYRLEEVIDAEELFKAYPQLRETIFKRTDFTEIADTPKELEYAQRKIKGTTTTDGKILINEKVTSKKRASEILTHEIQHLIQEIEGYDSNHNKFLMQDEDGNYYTSNDYLEESNEREARQVQNRNLMSKKERRNVTPKETSSKVDFKRYSLDDNEINTYSRAAYDGQVDMTKEIKDNNGNVIAKLDYSLYEDTVNVQMIEVDPNHRRKGLGMKLLQDLQKQYPDTEIDFGMSTPDGTKLLEKATYTVENKEVADKLARIEELQKKLDEYDKGYEYYFDNDIDVPRNYAEDYNELYDEMRRLQEETRNKKATKTFVKTDNVKYSLEERVSGDELLDAQDLIEDIKSVGGEVDDNGYVTLYHQTTTENANEILETGKMTAKEFGVFFSTSKNAQQSDGRGTTKLEFKIPAEKLLIDDMFDDNIDVKIPLNRPGEFIDVSDYLVKSDNARYSLSEETEAPTQDTKGRKFTKGQKEFFKNEDANLLDKDGNIKVLYHGTPFGKFTTFKGKMFFFSEDYNFARDYADSKSFEQGLDGDREVIEAYIKAENVFDVTDPADIQKLREAISDDINFWGRAWDKETLLKKLQRKDTLPPKWKSEQIEGKKFGDYIGDDRDGYNTDMFVGVNEQNEIVYISQERDLQKLSQIEKDMFQEQLMSGKEVSYETYQTIYGDMTKQGIQDKISELRKQGEEYKKENGFENEATDYYIKELEQTLKWIDKDLAITTQHKLIPKTTSQESTELTDIDNWTYFETAFDRETGKDIVDIVKDLGYDAINIYESGISNYIVFNPNQIKNVTNENPTSNPDINMSLSEANEDVAPIGNYNVYGKDVKADNIAEEEIAPASQEVVDNVGMEHFKSLTDDDIAPTETEGTFTFNDGVLPKIKGKQNIINKIRSNFNIKTTEARDLYNKIANAEYETVDDVLLELESYRDVKFKETNDYYADIQKDIRGVKLDISNIKGQIADYGRSYRASLMGKGIYLGNQGQAIDDFYQELSETYPSVFPADITHEADQLEAIANFMYEDTTYTVTDTIPDEVLYDLAKELYAEIGNNERYRGNLAHDYFQKQAIKNGELVAPVETQEDYLKTLPKTLDDSYAPYLDMAKKLNGENTIENSDIADELNRLSTNAQENTNQTEEGKKEGSKVTKKKGTALDTLKYLVTNRNVAIDNYAKEVGNNNIKFLADHVNNVYGEVSANINNVQTDNYGKAIGKSITDIFNQARKAGLSEAFNDYLFHRSNVARHGQGKGSQITLLESDLLIKEYNKDYPQFKKWASEVNQYNRNNLYKQVEAGLYTKEFADNLTEKYSFYVPFFEDIEKNYVENKSREIGTRGTVKRAKGGADRNLLDFEQAMMKQTQSAITSIRKNQLYKEIVNSSKEKLTIGIGNRDASQLFADEKGYYLVASDGGVQTATKISEDLYKGLQNNLEQQIKDIEAKLGGVTKTLQGISNWRRKMLTTWSPTFLAKNFFKDFQDAPLNSKYAISWAKNYPKALKELTTGKGQYVQEFLNMYGQANLMGNYVTDSGIFDVTKTANIKDAKTKNKIKKLFQMNEIVELAPRYAEYLASLEHGTSQMEALYNAREVTTNFGRGGVITKAMNRNGFTFLNASVQGFDKLIRNFSGENGAKGVVKATLKATMIGIAPALINAMMYDDDEEYQALPDYVKDNYYLIKTPDGKYNRIPKGRMLSIFGSAARRTLELTQGEEDAFEGFLQNAWSQVGVGDIGDNNIFSPFEQAFGSENGETWYGTDIVPSRLQDVPEAEQYDETTDKFSIWLGEKTGISPYKINYVIDQYSGGIGDILLPLITEEGTSDAETLPEMLLAPMKDQFVVDSTTDNKYVSDVYSLSDELYKKSNSAYATDEDKLVSQYIYSITSEMGELYAERREVQNDDSLTKAEKYEKSQAIKDEINRLAKEGLDGYKNVNKTENYAIVSGREFNKYTANDGTERWGSVYEDVLEEMNSLGMELEEKSEFFKAQSVIGDIKERYDDSTDYNAKKRDIITVIKGTNLTDDQKAYLYDKYYASSETLNAVTTLGIDFNSYLDFESQVFEADVDRYGKTISGSKKKKVFDYINSMNIDFEQKLILAKLQYNSYDEYNYEIINYLNNSNLSYEEEVELLKKMGFEVDDAGNIYW